MRRLIDYTYRQARRVVVAVIGGTVVLAGVVMIVTPGPAFVVIPLGLAILATEFVWARRLLHQVKERVAKTLNRKPPASEGERGTIPVAGRSAGPRVGPRAPWDKE